MEQVRGECYGKREGCSSEEHGQTLVGDGWERVKVDEGESSNECEAAGRAGDGLTRLSPKLFHAINRTL